MISNDWLQDLLWKSALTEVNKEKAVQKIEYHTTRMFPDRKNAPTQESYIKEMSEGIKELGGDVDEDSEVSSVSENSYGVWREMKCIRFHLG